MIDKLLDWLEGDPLRWHCANALLVTAILGLAGPARMVMGAVVLAALAFWSLACGLRGLRARGGRHPFDLALAFAPQAIGIAVAAGALRLASVPGWLVPGLVLFAGQVLLVLWWNAQAEAGRMAEARPPRWMQEAV